MFRQKGIKAGIGFQGQTEGGPGRNLKSNVRRALLISASEAVQAGLDHSHVNMCNAGEMNDPRTAVRICACDAPYSEAAKITRKEFSLSICAFIPTDRKS